MIARKVRRLQNRSFQILKAPSLLRAGYTVAVPNVVLALALDRSLFQSDAAGEENHPGGVPRTGLWVRVGEEGSDKYLLDNAPEAVELVSEVLRTMGEPARLVESLEFSTCP
jgi:hypothetical protein